MIEDDAAGEPIGVVIQGEEAVQPEVEVPLAPFR
jgi:hypothetical protein